MRAFEEKDYKIFDMFQNKFALVTAGDINSYNGCTISWGSLGTLWGTAGICPAVATVYIHPARYTHRFMMDSPYFTLSFFPPEYRRALGYMGSRSGRYENKAVNAGLSPIAMGSGVAYKEAELTFLCRKVYQQQFIKEALAPDIQEYYKSKPGAYPPDENGQWHPHWAFYGEIIQVEDKT